MLGKVCDRAHWDAMTSFTRPAAAVFDLDGTLTDTRHRNRFIESRPKRWDEFFAAGAGDAAHPEGLAALATAVDSGLVIVYLSGRPERNRELSQDWLDRHDCPAGELILRSDRDRSSSTAFKLRALTGLAARHQLRLLVDDDPDVVAAVRKRPDLVEQVMLATWQPRQISTPFERE